MNFTTIIDVIIFTGFLISLTAYFQRPTPLYLRIFPLYYFGAFVIGLIETYLSDRGRNNTIYFNTWGAIEFCFYFFVLREIIVNSIVRRIILYVLVLYPLTCIILVHVQKANAFNAYNFTIGCLISVLFCIYYFMELFQEAEAKSLASIPAFWIVTGILFSNVLTFPSFALISFMKETPRIIANNINAIFLIINLLTIVSYSIGFLCRLRIRKSSL
jgi:xanthine/uracil permease